MADDADTDMGDRRKSLMSHEITRARLRLLTPISEDFTSPRARIKNKNMVAITDKLDLRQAQATGLTDEEILKKIRELQGNPGEMSADPKDLKNLVESYLNDPRYPQGRQAPLQPTGSHTHIHMHTHSNRAPRPTLLGHRPAHCSCCESINRENRGRRREEYPEQYGFWTDTPATIEMIPYGSPGQGRGQGQGQGHGPVLGRYSSELVPPRGNVPTLPNPGAEHIGQNGSGNVPSDGPRIQIMYPNYEGGQPMSDSNQDHGGQSGGQYNSMLFPTGPGAFRGMDGDYPGSATSMYPYLPRDGHSYGGRDYDIYSLHAGYPDYSSNYERYLMEDIMAAARRYDTNMHRLEGKIDSLSPRDSHQTVTYKGRFDDK